MSNKNLKNNSKKSLFEFNKIKIADLKKIEKEYSAFKIKQYKKIKSIKSKDKNFENTILELCDGDKEYSDKLSAISVLMNVHIDKKFRDEAVKTITSISQKSVDIEYDKDLYLAVLDYYKNNFELEKSAGILEACDIKLVEDIVRNYKKMGFDLPENKRELLKNKLKNLSELQNNFDQNLNNYKDFILVNDEDLKEMPKDFISILQKEKDLYKVDLSYPQVGPFLKYSSNRKLKKELADKNAMKGGKVNLKILEKIVKLRIEISKILGYKTFVDFQVENRMAKNNENIQKFLQAAKKEIIPAGKKDIKELKDFAKKNLNIKNLEYFDLAYVSNKLYESKYNLNEKEIKEYFEMENTLSFMFDYFGEIFGFTAIEEKELSKEMWHPDVKVIKFLDTKSKNLLGYLLLDLYPRDGKYTHMCSADTKIYDIKVNTLICNFTKPNKNTPSLLSPYEVETLFHEFGHAAHFIFGSQTKHNSQHSFTIAWDIIELPSQMLENFFYNDSILKKLSRHYKTKKSLDKKIIEKIISAKNFQNGYTYMRQLTLTNYDLDLHLQKFTNNLEKEWIKYFKDYTGMPSSEKNLQPAGFGHIAHGYEAGYYSYLWAQIYALDIYDQFAQHITNKKELKKIGMNYRREILEVGSSREESESIKKFLGRELNTKIIKQLFR